MAADREESKNNQVEDRHSGDTWVIKWTIYNKLSGPIAEKDVKKGENDLNTFVCLFFKYMGLRWVKRANIGPPAVLNKSTIKTSSFIHQIINEMSRTNSARQYNHLLYRNTECTSLASYAAPQKTMHKIS